jgi:hypothetical protein
VVSMLTKELYFRQWPLLLPEKLQTDNLLMNRVIIFIILMLLKYTEMLWDFNFRKSYWFNREETFLMMSDVLWVLIFFFLTVFIW